MLAQVPLFPEQASTIAPDVDSNTRLLVLVSAFFVVVITGFIFYFAVKYRRKHEHEYPRHVFNSLRLELIWTIAPLFIVIYLYYVSSRVYFRMSKPPENTIEVYVIGKQWMWHLQHLGGQRENQELHVPVNRPVKLTMTSQDVIHNFSIPAFRVKMDVIPGRYTSLWFEANKPGKYHLFCAEYCGTNHSRMVGWIHVMEQDAYQAWLASPRVDGSMASEGRKLFQKLQCVTCHSNDSLAKAPNLEALFGRQVPLENGGTALVDESYLRRSILAPDADIHLGFRSIMPSFKGQVSESELMQLIAYLKTLGPGETPPRVESSDPPGSLPSSSNSDLKQP